MLKGREFVIHTDYKSLIRAASSSSDHYSPRTIRHDMSLVRKVRSPMHLYASTFLFWHHSQFECTRSSPARWLRQAQHAWLSFLRLADLPLPQVNGTICCDISSHRPCPVVPRSFRRVVFDSIHNLAHPGGRAPLQFATELFVWMGVNEDVRDYAHTCLQCQRV